MPYDDILATLCRDEYHIEWYDICMSVVLSLIEAWNEILY